MQKFSDSAGVLLTHSGSLPSSESVSVEDGALTVGSTSEALRSCAFNWAAIQMGDLPVDPLRQAAIDEHSVLSRSLVTVPCETVRLRAAALVGNLRALHQQLADTDASLFQRH